MDYNVIWYFLVGFLLIGYAILDGFDLGVGIVHLFVKGDYERRILLNSIGPVWDGNEVWLVTAGGALFAAFPEIYATAFSSFYLPFMLLLFALIFRAVSIEFRSKEPNPLWRKTWDVSFSVGSFLASLLFGVAIGNAILGLKIGDDMEYQGNVLDLLNPYTILCGVFNTSMFALHGIVYLNLKTEKDLQKKIQKFFWIVYPIFVALFLSTSLFTFINKPEMIANFSFGMFIEKANQHYLIKDYEIYISVLTWLVVALNILSIANIPRCIKNGNEIQSFVSSSLSIMAIIGLFALGLFPNLLISSINENYSLNIYNGSSTNYTLTTMFQIAIWGLPFVFAYTGLIYWTYRGKTILTKSSY